MKAFEFKGTITKIVRANGKANAQMVIEIPTAKSAELPLGDMIISMEQTQSPLFPPEKTTVEKFPSTSSRLPAKAR